MLRLVLSVIRYRAFHCAAALALFALHGTADAVPSFARQMGMQCAGCHTVFPELNSFGRQFKLRAYALGNANANSSFPANLPVSAILQVSRTMTADPQGVDPEVLPRDREVIPQAAGIYYAGRITEHSGALVQYSYDGAERRWATEMADIRFGSSVQLPAGKDLVYGVTLNNAPTLTDIFNSTPMWGFPHVASLGLMPAASPLLDMQLNSQVAGVTAYGLFDNLVYAEAGLYRSASTGVLRPLGWGVEKTRALDGSTPYWRLALQRDFGAHSVELGMLGLNARVFANASDRSMSSDRFRDLAVDAQYQYNSGAHTFTSHLLHMRERQRLDASMTAGMASSVAGTLRSTRLDAHYWYKQMVGFGVQRFVLTGSSDPIRYGMGPVMGSANGKPDTSGWIAEVNYLPRQDVKLALRRTAYGKFNGGTVNYDGFGRNASANNSWYLLAWLMF